MPISTTKKKKNRRNLLEPPKHHINNVLCSKSSIILKQKIIWGNKISNGIVFPVNVTWSRKQMAFSFENLWLGNYRKNDNKHFCIATIFNKISQFQCMLRFSYLEESVFLFYTGNKTPSHFLQYCC